MLEAQLRQLLPEDCLQTSAEQNRPFEADGLSAYRSLPMIVVLPENVAQVKAVLQCCHNFKVPVVTRGAGTGLSGGALPHRQGVLLVLTKLNRILDIDPDNMTARLEPGVRNLAISEAAAIHGLYYAPDPSSQIACSIGGNVAENAGGVHCLKYGLTVNNIVKLELLTASGEPITLGGSGLDSAGFDLLSLMTGSEGMLGVVTEITVKLLPRPIQAKALLAAFASVGNACAAVADIITAGITPGGLEMMDNTALCAAEDFANAGYPKDAAAILLVELDGHPLSVAAETNKVQQLLEAAGATSIQIAKDEQQRQRFWAGRKNAFPAVGRLSPDYYCMDGTIPRRALAEVLQYIDDLSQQYQLTVANVFHAGDGNLHPLILFDANQPGEFEKVEEMGAKVLEKCIAVGGTITGEHGVGLEKINQMVKQFSDQEIRQFHAIKRALDPDDILNPGKNIPTLRRCQEYRALQKTTHHHNNQPNGTQEPLS
ncbi:MAG: FAD-linked oxidase C-terminal domain-containing protein [Pseudomonadales bacterium]